MEFTPYKLRECIEDRDKSQNGGINALLTAESMRVYTRLNALDDWYKERPRLDLKASVGAATGHRIVCSDGKLRFDCFVFTVAVQIVTEPRNSAEQNDLHEEMCEIVRKVMSGIGGQSTFGDTVNFPEIYIAEILKDTGVTDNAVDEEAGLEYTTLSWDGIVCIRREFLTT
jgi:hypothetical protein